MKTVKVRKPHTCPYCGREIRVGQMATYEEGKFFALENGKCVGFRYWKEWFHLFDDKECNEAKAQQLIEHNASQGKDPDDLPF